MSARLVHGGDAADIWFESRGAALTDRADPFVPIATLLGILRGAPVVIEGTVSPQLLRGVEEFQEIFTTWYPPLWPVPVTAAQCSADDQSIADAHRGDGAFFSGGIDSFYTAITKRAALSHLVFVLGFDIPITNAALAANVLPPLRRAAAALGKPLVEVATNVRTLLDPIAKWDRHAYGPALSAVALALAPALRTVSISSDLTYRMMPPNGSHPLTDPLWSTEATTIIHFGADRGKGEKFEAIGRDPVVLDYLRVCWRNPDDGYNCGRCRKCLRARSALAALGVLDRCRTLPPRLTPSDLWGIATAHNPNALVRSLAEDISALAERCGAPWPLRAALRLAASSRREAVQRWGIGAATLPRRALLSVGRRLGAAR